MSSWEWEDRETNDWLLCKQCLTFMSSYDFPVAHTRHVRVKRKWVTVLRRGYYCNACVDDQNKFHQACNAGEAIPEAWLEKYYQKPWHPSIQAYLYERKRRPATQSVQRCEPCLFAM